MSVRMECERRLVEAKLKIKTANSELATLTRKRDEAIAAGNAADAIRFKNQLKSVQELLEDSTITKLALEAKVRVYEKNEPEAVKVRERIEAAWAELVDVYAGMRAGVEQARKAITEGFNKAGPLEAEVNSLAAKHMQLTGEALRIPDLTLLARAYHDARGHLVEKILDGRLSPWTYVGETERLGAAVKQQAKAKAAQAARVKVAIEQAPECPVCKEPMTLRLNVGHDGEERTGSGTWLYEHCFKLQTKKVPETVVQ
jgi:hypothetical protein